MSKESCFHCGLAMELSAQIAFDEKIFCCKGCQTVYEIFSLSGLQTYYELGNSPGATPIEAQNKYDFLEQSAITERLLDFNEGTTAVVSLYIPHIHCSSCIWILENLAKLQPGISSSQVNFPKKKARIIFNSEAVSLKEIVLLLCRIGYEPYISLEEYDQNTKKTDRSLIYKLGVAFFCFGNIMLLSFPEYFEVGEHWLEEYKGFFRATIFVLALPTFLYSASGYYIAAWNALRNRMLNIEIPIALGIIVMFIRSSYDMLVDNGPGFFDSLASLVFFMLLGKMFQSKTYDFLSFERDYKSYFPIAVTRLSNGSEENIPVYEVSPSDRLLLRNQELIPADGILISESASIDYSFVTGEAVPVEKRSGDKIFAGGRQLGRIIEMEALQEVSQSYLTSLWSDEVFAKKDKSQQLSLTNLLSQWFTPALLLIAFSGFGYWIFIDAEIAFNVFTAVLIVACPCALALTAPFTLGNILRILGRQKCYLKNAVVIEQIAKIDTIVFDKTGTITTSKSAEIAYEGRELSVVQTAAIRAILRGSNHPLSRMLYDFLPQGESFQAEVFEESGGSGLYGKAGNMEVSLGSAAHIGIMKTTSDLQTVVHLAIDEVYYGCFIFHNKYRSEVRPLFESLGRDFELHLLSGDNQGEAANLSALLPTSTPMAFNQKPQQKLEYIRELQKSGKKVMMVGDGLNDAGALAQSDVGVAISENVNLFSPACDAILDATRFGSLGDFMKLSRKAVLVIKLSFGLSLLYNVVGLAYALSGKLLPLVAAIIMPLSTITIVSFVTIAGNYFAYRIGIFKSGKSNT